MNNYFEMVASENYIVKATSEYLVEMFEIKNNSLYKSLNTIYESGGQRIDFSENLKLVIVGNFYDGVQAIDFETSKVIWHNKKIKQIQKICISTESKSVYLLTESKNFFFLDIKNGEVKTKIPSVKNFFFERKNNLIIQKSNRLCLFDNGNLNLLYEGDGDYVDILSDEKNSIISEAYKGLKYIDNKGKNTIWTSNLEPGFVCYKIIKYNEISFIVFANYSTSSEVENYLIKINLVTGLVESKTKLKSQVISFCFSIDNKKLFCSNEEIIDL